MGNLRKLIISLIVYLINYGLVESMMSHVMEVQKEKSYKQMMEMAKKMKNRNDGKMMSRNTNLQATNIDDVRYLSKMKIGNPPQHFKVIWDAGSTNSWVASKSCKSNDGSCENFSNHYDESATITGKNTSQQVTIEYIDGQMVTGYTYTDSIKVGNLSGENFQFGDITSILNFGGESDFDGIMGFAYTSCSTLNEPGILEFLFLNTENQLENAIVSFWMPRGKNGEMTIGGFNEQKFYGPIHYFPIIQRCLYQLELKEYRVDGINGDCGNTVQGGNGHAIYFDTGSPYLYGPYNDVLLIATILATTGELFEVGSGIWVIDPLKALFSPPIIFKFNGCDNCDESKEFKLYPKDYLIIIPNGTPNGPRNIYVLGIIGMNTNGSPFWLFGNTFMHAYYTIFDIGRNQMGFAESKD